VSYRLFKKLTVDTFRAHVTASSSNHAIRPVKLSTEEENAIRYAGGYVTNKLMKHCTHTTSTVPSVTRKVVKFVECLCNTGCFSGEEQSFLNYTLEWTRKVGRGGLFYINNSTYLFYKEVEICTQVHLIPHLRTAT